MRITIVYDNEIYQQNIGLVKDWGFSCLIEIDNEKILFDTGAKGEILINNLNKLKIEPETITKIIISHEHWDHNGGLEKLSPLVKNVELYRFEKQKKYNNMKNKDSEKLQKITDNVFTTGRLPGEPVDEQSLILKQKNDYYVITGCSHSKVKNILKHAEKHGKIKGLIGGLHGFNEFDILKDLEIIIPCHCTKHIKEIKKLYPDKTEDGGVGKIINF